MKRTGLIVLSFTILFNIQGQGIDSGLVGYWSFNGNVIDQSGNGYNGTVLGATNELKE